MLAVKIMYLANVLVAGWIGITCLFFPKTAEHTIFTNGFVYSESFRLVGALWFAIFILSFTGLFYPRQMALVLVFQLVYKATWLLVVVFPALLNSSGYPKAMAIFFLIWVAVLLL